MLEKVTHYSLPWALERKRRPFAEPATDCHTAERRESIVVMRSSERVIKDQEEFRAYRNIATLAAQARKLVTE